MTDTAPSPPSMPSPEAEPRASTASQPRVGLSPNQRVLAVAFALLVVLVFAGLKSLVNQRSPENRLNELLPRSGAVRLDMAFDAAVHDRALEAAPWAKGPSAIRIADFAGKTIFLNFWATWCEPCVRELPSMLQLAHSLRDQDFVMLAVSYDESWKDIEDFFHRHLKSLPTNFVLARDPGLDKDPLRAHYGTEKLPETYILRGGRILDRFVNAHDWTASEKLEYFDILASIDEP